MAPKLDDSPESLAMLLDREPDDDALPSTSPAEDDLPEGLHEALQDMDGAKTHEERVRAFHNAVTLCFPSTEE
jgi:hypothetical protein